MRRRELLLGLAGAGLGIDPSHANVSSIRVFGGETASDPRQRFPLALLHAALSAAGRAETLKPVFGLNQRRLARAIYDGSIDLGNLPSLGILRSRVSFAAYPIRRGLLGLRLLLAPKHEVERLAAIDTLEQVKSLRMAVGMDWVERHQLRALGFRLVDAPNYRSLFDMVRGGRADCVGRGVNEVWDEVDRPELVGADLAVVPKLALFYPIDDYFVAGPERAELMELIRQGLTALVRSGAYWQILNRYFASALKRTALEQRRIFELHGFGVDPGTPLDLFDAIELRPLEGVFRTPALSAALDANHAPA